MKLEPFQRGMRELAPDVWITALRKVQNPNRAGLDIVSPDANFGALKVSPLFHLERRRAGGLPRRTPVAQRVGLL
jgi:phosphoadenosine phosphosulfate reductase